MKKWLPLIIAVLGLAFFPIGMRDAIAHTYSGAPTFTTWNTGDVLTSASLNNSLAHLHNTFSGNISDTHISATAAMQHSKLQYPALVPKAWASVAVTCTAGDCSVAATSRVAKVTWHATGKYYVCLTYTPVNAYFAAQLTSNVFPVLCNIVQKAANAYASTCDNTTYALDVECINTTTGADTNAGFDVTILDDNN